MSDPTWQGGSDGGDSGTVETVETVEAVATDDTEGGPTPVASDADEAAIDDTIMVLEDGSSPDLPDAVLPVWEPTGNADVDAALEDLHALADTDVTEHAAVYERVQSSLRGTLDGLVAEDEPAS